MITNEYVGKNESKRKNNKSYKKHGSITSYQAYLDLGITQLATRIKELKKEGYEFKTEWINKKRRDGIVVSYKKYMLKE